MARVATATLPTPISDPLVEPPTPPKLKALYTALVNTAAFACICELDNSETFQLKLSSEKTTPASDALADLDNIPSKYRDFSNVFSKTKANTLAKHWHYDLKIDLEEGSKPLLQLFALCKAPVILIPEKFHTLQMQLLAQFSIK
jgi:hypothetical protein